MTRLVSGVIVGVVALGFMTVAALLAPQDLVLLVGRDSVLSASTVALLAWGIGVVLVAVAIAIVVLRRARPGRPALPVAGVVVLIAGTIASGPWALGGFVRATAGAVGNSEQYDVIHSFLEADCALVVSGGHFIARSGGEIYVVDGGIGRLVSTWSGDDVQRPLEESGSGVTWRSSGGTLRLQGSAVQPSRLDFTCTG